MKVLIIGAGMGGLTLAQALRRKGIEAVVHERDAAVEDTGGYRLHLDERACAALRRHLEPAHYQALQASSAGPQAFTRFAVADHRMRLLFAEPRDRVAETLMIGRIPLRRLLAHGLDEGALRWGAEYTGHETHPDGTVTAHFADGRSDRGDLLVGADGAGSRVAAALAGRPTSAPAGVSGAAGRTPLTAATRPLVPGLLAKGPALAFGPGGIGLFLTVHDPASGTMADPASCTRVPAVIEPPTLIWGLLAPDRVFPGRPRTLDGSGLVRLTDSLMEGWTASVRTLVRAADPTTTAFFRFHAADPDTDLTPWPAGTVTALGDAVHAMPPTGGMAAATAIRDADILADELMSVHAGESTIPPAVHRFHSRMAAYSGDAVRTSMQPLGWVHRLATPVGSRAARMVLPTIAAAARLNRTRTGARSA